MKRLLYSLLSVAFTLCLLTSSCTHDKEDDTLIPTENKTGQDEEAGNKADDNGDDPSDSENGNGDEPIIPYFDNAPLPIGKETLRILAIGNSYTLDGTAYLQDLLDNLGLDRSRYCVMVAMRANSSLQTWSEIYEDESVEPWLQCQAGTLKMDYNHASLKTLLSQPWDIVVLQQVSYYAITYLTYSPWLRTLIDAVRTHCTNPDVCLAWHLVHSYSDSYIYNGEMLSEKRWANISASAQLVARHDGINVIIPMGTAIQNARNSMLENVTDLTRDHIHLGLGVARYIAACTWVETLFDPVFGTQMTELTANHPLTNVEENGTGFDSFILGSSIAVTDDNRPLCIQCAHWACTAPYQITTEYTEQGE
ncbi:MAG: DUF4886 domain-containing protein [Bacteroidaceae bacterium]|nr:DUF4886 domain-containing protein [Bacteroidaceae bacterium]